MQSKDIKYALKNYHKIKEHRRLNFLYLEEIQSKMEGTGGGSIVKFDKLGKEIPHDRTPLLLGLIEKKDKIEQKISEYTYYLRIAKDFAKSLEGDTKKMLIDKYINRMSNIELEGKYFYSERHILRIIDKKIAQFIEKK